MTVKKWYPLAKPAVPPPQAPSGWAGYVKPFAEMLRENPDQWFQFRPGVAHDSSRVQRIKEALPGVVVTTRRWTRPPRGQYSRPRKKTTKCDIYAVWPSVPGVVPEVPDFDFTEEDAAGMGVEYPPPKKTMRVEEPDDFRWEDFQ